LIEVTLYSRDDCHLCDVARADLDELQAQIPHKLIVIDVDSSKDLQREYGFEVPVIKVGPYHLKAPFSREEIAITLSAARDRARQITQIEEKDMLIGGEWSKADGFTDWFARHYMAVFNLFVLVYLGLPVLAPVLMKAGVESPARLIYRAYGAVCHQLAFRSIFLFGEQYVYPREAAQVDELMTFNQVTGLSEASTVEALNQARQFVGNEKAGYKIALCERDASIYGAILLFGLIFVLTGKRIPTLPWYLWVLLGLVPIGVDGVSQLLSQPPFNLIPYRESTPFLRILTGSLFGLSTAWFGYPLVEETMRETREIMNNKRNRIRRYQQRKQAAKLPGD